MNLTPKQIIDKAFSVSNRAELERDITAYGDARCAELQKQLGDAQRACAAKDEALAAVQDCVSVASSEERLGELVSEIISQVIDAQKITAGAGYLSPAEGGEE